MKTPLAMVRAVCALLPALMFAFAFQQPATAADAKLNSLSPAELDDGWILLFDGETLYGWQPASQANWRVADGVISVSEGEKGLLTTTSEFADYVLRVDFRYAEKTNSGVFLRTPAHPKDPAKDCYELNIAEPAVSPFPTGSFVNRQKGLVTPYSDGWHSYEVTAQGSRIRVVLDGREVLDYTDPQPLARGRIGLQLNSGPVEFRNIKLKPLGVQSIFNGRDLAGWHVLPDLKSVYSVTPAGELNVKNGRGALESDGRYADFVLQLDVFSNGKGLNSGIFFRSIPGEVWNGYESQINNAFKDDDRTKPKDCGTGGIYRRQDARKVVANDFEWFHDTIVVSGDHVATWINGYQVSDWTDTRAPNDNPRKGLRLAAGTLQIQGHDPTTDLSFRNLRIAEMK